MTGVARPAARRLRTGLGLLLVVATAFAHAQDWPSRPLRFIVPAGPGSSLDVIARLSADRLRETLGQPLVIDNRPAAGGTVGTAACASAAPDGHTMVLGFNGPVALAPFLYSKLPYDPARDLAPVVATTTAPNLLAVHADLPVRSVADLVAWARAQPGRFTYASVGNASASHLSMELFLSMAGIGAVHSPYNGAPPAAASLAQGETHAGFAAPTALLPHLKSGRVRAIAVTTRARHPGFPDLPTVAEGGLAGFEAVLWNGVLVPAGTPTAVIGRLNSEFNRVLALPDTRARLSAAGLDAAGGSPAAFAALIRAEVQRWSPLLRQLSLRLD